MSFLNIIFILKPAPKVEQVKSEKKSGEEKPQKQMLSFPITGSNRVPQTRPENSVICGTALHSQRLPIPATFISPQPQQSNRPQSNDRNDRERLLDRFVLLLILEFIDTIFSHKLLWQGYLSIKNDTATVHLNLIHGNADVPMEFLPRATGDTSSAPSPNRMATLKIVQRMRLEQNQVRKYFFGISATQFCSWIKLPSKLKSLQLAARWWRCHAARTSATCTRKRTRCRRSSSNT